mgnify:CR=1 FL=1
MRDDALNIDHTQALPCRMNTAHAVTNARGHEHSNIELHARRTKWSSSAQQSSGCRFEAGVDYDKGYARGRASGVATKEACCALCSKRADCGIAAYMAASQQCWFKPIRTSHRPYSNAGVVSCIVTDRLGPTSAAMGPAARNPEACRAFVYQQPHGFEVFRHASFGECLFEGCNDTHSFLSHTVYTFTSEVDVYRRLLRECTRTTNPATATLFVVPFWFGTSIVSGWAGENRSRTKLIRNWLSTYKKANWPPTPNDFISSLTHYRPATASRHVFFCSVDSQFVLASATTKESLWVHLGDENEVRHRIAVPRVGNATDDVWKVTRIPFNGLTIPYQIRHWISKDLLDTRLNRERSLFIYSNTNLRKHRTRVVLQDRLTLLNRSDILLESTMTSPQISAHRASNSRFCICPTGDSTGFTARLYFSLVHGCTPVFLDGWHRNIGWDDLALPFKTKIDWKRLIVYMPNPDEDVLDALSMFAPDYDYIEYIRPMLLFENSWTHRSNSNDASGVAVQEILERVQHGCKKFPAKDVVWISCTHTNTRG